MIIQEKFLVFFSRYFVSFCFVLTEYSCYFAVIIIVIMVDFIRFVRVMLNFTRSLSHLPIHSQ